MKKIYLLIILFILLPINVKAASLEFTCPKVATTNTTINCTLKTTDSLKGIKLSISLPAEISSTNIETNWNNYYKKNTSGIVATPKNQDSFNANITFKISSQATLGTKYNIRLINIEASDNEHNLVSIDDISSEIKIVSDDNTLSNLTITNGSLSPKFNKNTTTYTATVSKDKTTVTATPSSSTAKVAGNIGEVKLNYGVNKLTITVTSELGTTKTYNLTITRPQPATTKPDTPKPTTPSNNNTTSNKTSTETTTTTQETPTKDKDASLKSLKIKNHYIDFNPKKYTYKLNVKNNETSLEITATPNSSKAKVEIEQPETLEIGKNSIIITVTAEDGTICKYELEVTREKEKTTTTEKVTTGKKEESNKKFSIFPSIPLSILILIILIILLILFIIIKRIFKKDE
ncbi:MAG: cadherin-like beta sandwich domain-containing protein [Bacilli bacterium]|nr:cadherin-like beta sandwich domain-containing protein [Bacilli bacterium]